MHTTLLACESFIVARAHNKIQDGHSIRNEFGERLDLESFYDLVYARLRANPSPTFLKMTTYTREPILLLSMASEVGNKKKNLSSWIFSEFKQFSQSNLEEGKRKRKKKDNSYIFLFVFFFFRNTYKRYSWSVLS